MFSSRLSRHFFFNFKNDISPELINNANGLLHLIFAPPVGPHVGEQWNSSGEGEKKSWISYGARTDQKYRNSGNEPEKIGNAAGVLKIAWNSRWVKVYPISNGILEGLANFFRISLGVKEIFNGFLKGLRCLPWISLGVRMKDSKRPFVNSGGRGGGWILNSIAQS